MGVVARMVADLLQWFVPAFAQAVHWVGSEVEAAEAVVAVLAPKAVVAVAFELTVPAAGVEAGPAFEVVLEIEAEDEVGFVDVAEFAHMKKAADVLALQAAFAFEAGHTECKLAVDTEHTADSVAGKGHSQDTSDNTAGIVIVVAGTIVGALKPALQVVKQQQA